MLNPSELSSATIAELRQFAKERQITLGSLRTKSDILQRIEQSLIDQLSAAGMSVTDAQPEEETSKSEKPQASQPSTASAKERRAMIITDDPDDSPPAHSPVQRPQPAHKTSSPTLKPSSTTSTGKNKPVFNLSGARAWHNPQPYTSAQAAPNKYAPLTSNLQTYPSSGGDSFTNTMQTRPVPTRVARFGPDAAQQPKEAPAVQSPVTNIPPGYRPSAFAKPGAVMYPQALQAQAQRPANIASAYRRQQGEFLPAPPEAPADKAYLPSAAPVEPDARELGVNSAVPELLATGDCGDGAGVLDIHSDGYGFIRAGNFLPGKNDVYVSNAQIRRFSLRNGDYLEGKTRPQRDSDRYAAMLYITSINGQDPEEAKNRRDFDELTPYYPVKRIQLSSAKQPDPVLRFIDLFVPIGYGQRALIVAPPKAGKTTILKKIALSIIHQHPEIHLMTLLVDERPEEVTDIKETVGGDVFYSTFDEPAESHARVSELVSERAMRLVEQGKDVVILMDSLTRLSRAYNTLAPSTARIMSGGVAAGALNKPKRFFGAARNLKEGGSLTIIATAIVETGSRMDDMIYEEFKGTGNMELTLDRSLQEQRIFPAVSIIKSGTRHDELLLNKDEEAVAVRVRRMLAGSSEQEGISLVLSMMEKTNDNDDFVARFDQWASMMNTRGQRS
ncbi:MAG: transcription termination factor Rho [Clostridiales bacterium]|nr:transcription termination factor Rho [Clostridiales bacterium]